MAEHKVKDYSHNTRNKTLNASISESSFRQERRESAITFPMRRYRGAPIDVWCMSCYVIRNEPLDRADVAGGSRRQESISAA